MAKNNQPIAKRCKALGISPAVMGYNKKETKRNSAAKPKKKSEYALQLQEKQKAKFIYGVMEKQFHTYYEKAERMAGKTGENLLSLLERRLDNVVYRMGLANTRREARLLVSHAHYTLNGNKVDIPSILVNVGDVIAIKDSSRSTDKFKALVEGMDSVIAPKWLELDKTNGTAKVIALPTREDIDFPFEEQLIVELYSK